jgi:hypothetical protein
MRIKGLHLNSVNSINNVHYFACGKIRLSTINKMAQNCVGPQ